MKKYKKPFNDSSLKPFNNPKECEKLYLDKNDFYAHVYALKWNYIDQTKFLKNFDIRQLTDFFKVAYLLDCLSGSEEAYAFIKEYGDFNSLKYNEFINIEYLVFLLKVFKESGTDDDIKFILSIIKDQLDFSLPKTIGEPDIYTHASLHALIASTLRLRGNIDEYSGSPDTVIVSIDNDVVLTDIVGNTLVSNCDNDIKIAAMMRIRNEQENIEFVLNSINKYVDVIIIYDDYSDDNTIQIIKQCKNQGINIELIEGSEWLFNEALIHQILVDKGRSIGVTHYIQIDGDEIFSDEITPEVLGSIMKSMKPGDILALPWLNLTEDIDSYYSEEKIIGLSPSRSIKRYKDIAFADDGFSQYPEWLYSHVNVAPFTYSRRFLSLSDNLALLHLEQINLINYAAKKDWYRIRAYVQNKRLPADPYLDIRLHLLQLDSSVVKLPTKTMINDDHLSRITKTSYRRIHSNTKACEKYPQLKRFMYLDYENYLNIDQNITEK